MSQDAKIAYFSMEIALDEEMPTYSGGLGVLAGDTLKAAADMRVPMAAVTLLYRKGYCDQKIDAEGWQTEGAVEWDVERFLIRLEPRVEVVIEGRRVLIQAWKYEIQSSRGFSVPVYFLDTDIAENDPKDRALSELLYGDGNGYRICQEVVLGIGGVRMLRALGYERFEKYHMNEGHASLLTLELLDEAKRDAGRERLLDEDIERVRRSCVFTTHTPVAAGHDKFSEELVKQVLGMREEWERRDLFCCEELFNMTYLALNLSHYVNGVAKKHGETAKLLFGSYPIDSITNGVNPSRWTSPPFQELFDRHIPGWREDNFSLRYALSIPKEEIWGAHQEAKRTLFDEVNRRAERKMDPEIFTIGFGRRSAAYKRADLIFSDLQRLRNMAKERPFQLIFAGKAHPEDLSGKEMISRVYRAIQELQGDIPILYLENYDVKLAKKMTSGVDVWLNTPKIPMEASGTSGMKAALNGVPSLSLLDGWWLEGCIEGVTGWSIGKEKGSREEDALSLYDKLENKILPLFYENREAFTAVMQHAIALNGSFFNSQRMLQQYVLKAYFL